MARPVGYTGYYPGEKIPRTPSGRPAPYTPNEYDLNVLADTINDMYFNFGDIPGFVKERLDQGMKLGFTAALYSKHISADALSGYSEAELAEEKSELSGMTGFSISLDPRDIISNPKKWASKIPPKLWAQITDWKDLEMKKREHVWADLLGIDTDNGKGQDYKILESLQAQRAFWTAKEKGAANTDMLSIAGLKTARGTSLGKATACAIVDFESNLRSAFYRDGNFDKVLHEATKGARAALAEGIGSVSRTAEGLIVTPGTITDDDARMTAVSFMAQADLVEQVSVFGSNSRSRVNRLEKVIARLNEEEGALDENGKPLDLHRIIHGVAGDEDDRGILGDIERARAHLLMMREGTARLSADQRRLVGEARVALYESVTTGALLEPGVESAIKKQLDAFEESLAELEAVLRGDIPTTAAGRTKLLRRASAAIERISGPNDELQHGIERTLLKKVIAERLTGNKKIGGKDIKNLEDLFDPDSAEFKYLRSIRIVLPTLERDRLSFNIDDLLDTFYKDSVLDQFLWATRINPKLKALTPGYYVTRFMKRMSYFGLIIEDENLEMGGDLVNPKFFLYKWMNKFIRGTNGEGRRIFQNTFGISVAGLGKIKVAGGAHFEVVKSLEELKDLWAKDPQFMVKLITNPQYALDFLKVEYGSNSEVGKFLRNKFKSIKELEEWGETLNEKLQKFHDWLVTKGKALGIDIMNPKHLESLINELHLYNLNKVRNLGIEITTKYRGILETFTQKLNVLQNELFKGVLGKVAGTVIGWKMVVSHTISTAITGAITALTGGASSFIAGALEKVIQFSVKILLDTFEKVFASILKADFTEFYKFTEKALVNLLKWFAWGMGAIGVTAAMAMLSMMVILSAFSSQDNSKIGAVGGGENIGPGGPGTAPILPSISPGTCPHQTGAMTTPSYGYISRGNYDITSTAHTREGHGGNPYWVGVGYSYCAYAIPGRFLWTPPGYEYSMGTPSHSEAVNPAYCNNPHLQARSPYFGMAADFIPTPRSDMAVYLPILGEPVNGEIRWSSIYSYNSGAGSGILYTRNDGVNRYNLLILHINPNSQAIGANIPAGTHIGNLWDCWTGTCGLVNNTHTHVELTVNNIPVRPETVLCL
ncbi:MAG TPA: hypothetical protein PLT50_01915 [bacterium]|nr:hypothetical protein [bacterium]